MAVRCFCGSVEPHPKPCTGILRQRLGRENRECCFSCRSLHTPIQGRKGAEPRHFLPNKTRDLSPGMCVEVRPVGGRQVSTGDSLINRNLQGIIGFSTTVDSLAVFGNTGFLSFFSENSLHRRTGNACGRNREIAWRFQGHSRRRTGKCVASDFDPFRTLNGLLKSNSKWDSRAQARLRYQQAGP